VVSSALVDIRCGRIVAGIERTVSAHVSECEWEIFAPVYSIGRVTDGSSIVGIVVERAMYSVR